MFFFLLLLGGFTLGDNSYANRKRAKKKDKLKQKRYNKTRKKNENESKKE